MFAEGEEPNFIYRTEIWFSGFRLTSLVKVSWSSVVLYVSGTNEHSNSDPIQNSETCFTVSQVPQDKMHKKKGRPAKGSATSTHGRLGVRCPVCNKTFNNSSALAKHKLTHSDERKYVCSTCCKTFKRQDHL